MSHLHVFTCQKRAYVIFGRLDFGFVLHKKLIISYEFFRRVYFVPVIGVPGYQEVVIRISGYQGALLLFPVVLIFAIHNLIK